MGAFFYVIFALIVWMFVSDLQERPAKTYNEHWFCP